MKEFIKIFLFFVIVGEFACGVTNIVSLFDGDSLFDRDPFPYMMYLYLIPWILVILIVGLIGERSYRWFSKLFN